MKRILLILISVLISTSFYAQKNFGQLKEYVYINYKLGIINNFSPSPANNPDLMIKSVYGYGDLIKEPIGTPSYTPGLTSSLLLNFDLKNNILGFVSGVRIQNYGFHNTYRSLDKQYTIQNHYRTTDITIPFIVKYWYKNIYRDQTYLTFGLEYHIYYLNQNIQIPDWNKNIFIGNLTGKGYNTSSIAFTIGFNYSVYYISLFYNFKNFLDKDYSYNSDEGQVYPFSHINAFNNIYITVGYNIPLTRWITYRSWTFEKIRRMFIPAK